MTVRPGGWRIESAAFAGFGAAWLVIAGLIAIVLRLQVPTPAELLEDVAASPVAWIAANVLLIVAPLSFSVIAPVLRERVGPGSAASLAATLLLVAGVSLIASGVFHGVFGAHLAARVDDDPRPAGLVEAAEVVHAVGDTWWFVGVGALMALTALVCATDVARHQPQRRFTVWIGALSVVANLGQFGWFFDHAFGVFAAPGTVLQAAWFFAIALELRDAESHVDQSADRRGSAVPLR
jgi:hypothetical protein